MFIFFVSLRLCSSHLLAALSEYVFCSTCSFCLCHICTLPHLGVILFFIRVVVFLFFFRSSYFSGGVFFLLCSRTRYASTWFAYLDSLAFVFSLSHCMLPHNWYLSRMKNQEGHWGYCWCRWEETTVYCENNNIVIRTCDQHKNLYITLFLLTIFGPHYMYPM